MIWFTGNEEKNFSERNMKNVIYNLNIPGLNSYFDHNDAYVEVRGLVHRSQWTSDNPDHRYWIRVLVFDEYGMPVMGLSALHIFLCFHVYNQNPHMNRNYVGSCITPEPIQLNGDYPDTSPFFGNWEARAWSNGPQIRKNPHYKKATPKQLEKMKAKSSKSPEALALMKGLLEQAKKQ
mgnify:CR=1 FL=1|jgi:hypothetical protein|tara:strand:- start:8953 stop:9486 length:534 start_codon:yes stop_codon:yes gene_type:complete